MPRSLVGAHQQPLSFTLSSRNSNSPSTVLSHVSPPIVHTCPPPLSPSASKLSYKYRSSFHTRSVSDSTETAISQAMEEALDDAQKLRAELLKVLRSRRSGEVPLSVETAKPVAHPLFQEASPPSFSEATNACPKANIPNLKEGAFLLTTLTQGAEDPRCPLAGLEIPKSRAWKAYEDAHSTDNFKLIAEPGIGPQMTALMVKEPATGLASFSCHDATFATVLLVLE